jgi:hypothetical protein
MVLACDLQTVQAFIEFELIKLAERINVSGNLTDSQIQFIAAQLVEMYPNETIADFKICFESAAMGKYGKLFKLDGIEVGQWMKTYLDEKYQVLETELMKEKEDMYKPVKVTDSATDPVKHQEWLNKLSEAVGLNQKVSTVPKLTEKEIRSEGQEKPKYKPYVNGITREEYELKKSISRAGADFYKLKPVLDLKRYLIGTIEVMAETESDAKSIYENAVVIFNQATK